MTLLPPILISSVDPPQITENPANWLDVDPGSHVVFTVAATDTTVYQWQLNERDLLYPLPGVSGTTTATLTIYNVDKTDEGMYRCILINAAGHVISHCAQLTVCEFLKFICQL